MGKTVRRESYDEYNDYDHHSRKGEKNSKKKSNLRNPHKNTQYQENDVYYDIETYKNYYR